MGVAHQIKCPWGRGEGETVGVAHQIKCPWGGGEGETVGVAHQIKYRGGGCGRGCCPSNKVSVGRGGRVKQWVLTIK